MKNRKIITSGSMLSLLILIVITSTSCGILDNESGVPINENIWVNGFLGSWQHNPETELINSGLMTNDQIDWNGLTHLTYYSLPIDSLGLPAHPLDPEERLNFNSDRLKSIVPAAHERGVNILFSVDGTGEEGSISSMLRDENRPQLIETLQMILTEYSFDGVHLNFLQMEPTDYLHYRRLIREISETFDTVQTKRGRRPLLTAVALKGEDQLRIYADLHPHFDQIHILTYDMVQPWRGWKAWHGAALFNDNVEFEQEPGRLLPSTHDFVTQAIATGIPRSKIGIAISFYSQIWEGVHLRERWDQWPEQNLAIMWRVPYRDLRQNFTVNDYRWDSQAKAPYLQVDNPKIFVSFENEASVAEKVRYTENMRIGGVMLWELGGGYLENGQHPLLQSVREATYQYRSGFASNQ